MPFPDNHSSLDTLCRRIADGRRLARRLALALREHELGEAEFRLLWLLLKTERASLEQSLLVEELGLSPAQVSALVERLRSQKMIAPVVASKDRRRKLWQLTASGRKNFAAIIATVERTSREGTTSESIASSSRSPREDAA